MVHMIIPPKIEALIQQIRASGQFDEAWYLKTYPDVALSGLGAIEHYLRIGAWLGREPNITFDTESYLRQHPEITGLDIIPFVHAMTKDYKAEYKRGPIHYPVMSVDEPFYLMHNPSVAAAGKNARQHFETSGYKELRNPCADFDIWWYTQTYLLGTPDCDTNALVHYNETGADLGYRTRPPLPVTFHAGYSRKLPDNARRIFLFAAYDVDGIIDDYVLAYLRDLAQYGDIYYLADCAIDAAEMSKLDGLVKGAWAMRHGMYDFGSYSILARDLVGWDVIEAYDELILANDSCYLVHPLEDTFTKMAVRPCAWWGLQATKGLISTKHQNRIAADAPVSITDIKETYLDLFEADPLYDFHIGSYFMAFRKDVIIDPDFQKVLNTVTKEASKLNVIRKYEIGLTRFLIGKGYTFDTLVETVSKQHPMFTERAFDLINDGFPLLKRIMLTENHHKVAELGQWTSRLQHANPDVDIALFEKNLYRVGDALKLYNNFHIEQDPNLSRLPRSNTEMQDQDLTTPTYDHWWAFPACADTHLLSGLPLTLFERVKNNPDIKKIILTRSSHITVDGVNVVVVPLQSYDGQSYLLRARQIFLSGSPCVDVESPLSSHDHHFHNLWHDGGHERIGQASLVTNVLSEPGQSTCTTAPPDVDQTIAKVMESFQGSKLMWEAGPTEAARQKHSVTFVYVRENTAGNRTRIFNLIEHLQALDWTCRIVTEDRLSSTHLKSADAMVIYCCPMTESLCDYCETFRTLGGKIIFDTDDLVNDFDSVNQLIDFRDNPPFSSDLSMRTLQMIETADLVTVGTTALAENMRSLARQVEVIPDSLSASFIREFPGRSDSNHKGGTVRLCYFPSNRATSGDFETCCAALATIRKRYPQLELHIFGMLDTHANMDIRNEGTVIHRANLADDHMHHILKDMDIHIAPLAPSYLNDCKSPAPIFNAALHAIPSIASDTRSYAETITHQKTGMLVNTQQEWEGALDLLINDTTQRQRLGRAAFDSIAPRFAARKSAHTLAGIINVLLRHKARSRLPR